MQCNLLQYDHKHTLLSALLQLHLHSQLSTWLQLIERRQLHEDTRNISIWGFGATYTRGFTETWILTCISNPGPITHPYCWIAQYKVKIFTTVYGKQRDLVVEGFGIYSNQHHATIDARLRWRHQMKHFPCYWPFVKVIHRWWVESPHKGQWCDVELWYFFDLRLNKRLSKQNRRRWFVMPSRSLWCHCDIIWDSN